MRLSSRSASLALGLFVSLLPSQAQQGAGTSHSGPTRWKEYIYPAYGFAVTLPEAAEEIGVKNGTQYRLYWDEDKDVVVNLTANLGFTDCASWLDWAKSTFKQPPPGSPFQVSSKLVTIDGDPALESDRLQANDLQAGYNRQQCLDGRLYSFEARWPKGQRRPTIVNRIIKSFRVLATETKQ